MPAAPDPEVAKLLHTARGNTRLSMPEILSYCHREVPTPAPDGMRILLTGRSGRLGSELVKVLGPLGRLHATAREELNLSSQDQLVRTIRETRPHLIVNAAAVSNTDRAEREPEAALEVNAHAPRILAEEAKRIGAALIHFSTCDVFDGSKGTPYVETDLPCPINVVGRTRRLGEGGVRASGVAHLILRVGWLYAGRGSDPLATLHERFAARRRVGVADDQRGNPTWSRCVAVATATLIEKLSGDGPLPLLLEDRGGTYHLPAGGDTTWYGFACAAAEGLRSYGEPLAVERIEPTTSATCHLPAPRPPDARLCGDRIGERLGIDLPGWHEQLEACLRELASRRKTLVG